MVMMMMMILELVRCLARLAATYMAARSFGHSFGMFRFRRRHLAWMRRLAPWSGTVKTAGRHSMMVHGSLRGAVRCVLCAARDVARVKRCSLCKVQTNSLRPQAFPYGTYPRRKNGWGHISRGEILLLLIVFIVRPFS